MRVPEHIRRHRVFQILLSTGIGVCFVYHMLTAGLDPVVLGQTLISWVWIWEE